jgi:hypothetical protein
MVDEDDAERDEEEEERVAFREEVIELLEGSVEGDSPIEEIELDDDDLVFEVRLRSGTRVVVNLNATYDETRALDGEKREQRLERFVRGTVATWPKVEGGGDDEGSWDEVAERLVPLLRAAQHYAAIPRDKRPCHRRWDTGLIELAGIDSDDTITQVNDSHLKRWGKTFDQVLDASVRSFAECTSDDDVEIFDDDVPYPIWHVARDDDYQSSRLLIPGWLAAFDGRVTGRPIAIVPDRNTCIVSDDDALDAIARLIEIARDTYKESPRRITPVLYTVDDRDEVVPLTLPANHPHHAALAINRYHFLVNEYALQASALDKELQERGEDVFVASYAVENIGGGLASWCSWGENIASSLPVTDLVAFAGKMPDGKETWMFFVARDAVEALAGDCWRRDPEIDPPRMRTVKWPSAATLDKLRARQIKT